MLKELTIVQLGAIAKSVVSFGTGLNVISGESGTGKSLILHALELVLGAKPKATTVAHGASKAEVHAVFHVPAVRAAALPEIARDDEARSGEDVEVSIVRTIPTDGRSRYFVNGRPAASTVVEELSSQLLNICGQHAHVKLLHPRYHGALLDQYAANNVAIGSYQRAYTQWREVRERLQRAQANQERIALRLVEVRAVVEELEKIKESLLPNALARLEALVQQASSVEVLQEGIDSLTISCTGEGGLYQQLQGMRSRLREITRHAPGLASLDEFVTTAQVALESLETELVRFGQTLETDPEVLEEAQSSLSEVQRTKRKYKLDEAGLLQLLERASTELAELEAGEDLDQLQRDVAVAKAAVLREGAVVSLRRATAAKELSTLVTAELAELGMEDRLFSVCSKPLDEPTADGLEEIAFLLGKRGNSDRALPLAQIASGGELSRLLLVLKKLLNDSTGVNVLVFDEVDTGVSGAIARSMGEKLKKLAQSTQVLCISHLPQVASLADQHILVSKSVRGEVGQARLLDGEERVEEIARMMSGKEITRAARASARELLEDDDVKKRGVRQRAA